MLKTLLIFSTFIYFNDALDLPRNLPKSWLKIFNSKPELRQKILLALQKNSRPRDPRALGAVIQTPNVLVLRGTRNSLIGIKAAKIRPMAKMNRQKQSIKELANPLFRVRVANFYYKRIRDHPDMFIQHLNSPMFGSMTAKPIMTDPELLTNKVSESNDENPTSITVDEIRDFNSNSDRSNFGSQSDSFQSNNRYYYDWNYWPFR